MLARIWHCRVPAMKSRAHGEYLTARAVPYCRPEPGSLGTPILDREDHDAGRFITLTISADLEAMCSFAGDVIEAAKQGLEHKGFLPDLEPTVTRYKDMGKAR